MTRLVLLIGSWVVLLALWPFATAPLGLTLFVFGMLALNQLLSIIYGAAWRWIVLWFIIGLIN